MIGGEDSPHAVTASGCMAQFPPDAMVGINGNLAGTLLASYYKGTGMRCGQERDVVLCASSGQSHAEILRELSPTLNCASEQPYVVRPGGTGQEQPIVTHPQIAGTLCASGAGLSRPAGQGNELDFCVVSAGFKHKAGSQSGSIGFQEETAPTLMAGQQSAVMKASLIGGEAVIKAQTAAVDCRNLRETDEVSGTLLAKAASGGYSLNYQMWLSLLISHARKRYRQGQTLRQGRAKVAAAEAEGKLVQIGLEVFLGQAMIGTQDKRFGVADHDVQPMEQAGIGVIGFVFMEVALQSWKVTAITIAVDHAAIGKGGMGKFLHRRLLDVGRYPHFQKVRIALLIQRQRHENLLFFCAPAPLFTHCWATKVRIIKFDDTAQLMGFIPLAHSGANAPEHGPCGFVGSPKHCRQLHCGNTPLVLAHEIERQKPLRQWHMGLVQHCPCCYRGLIAALGALISPVG